MHHLFRVMWFTYCDIRKHKMTGDHAFEGEKTVFFRRSPVREIVSATKLTSCDGRRLKKENSNEQDAMCRAGERCVRQPDLR